MAELKEKLGFQTEVKQLLNLMIHSLYSNKEIFLRELISNASDASDKLRFAAIADSGLYEGDSELKIRVSVDKINRTITISDNGIGISPEHLTRIFAHGFTTKKDGHGFGLHSAVLFAHEMGGVLNVSSDGPGHGATFTLKLPRETGGQLSVSPELCPST